MRHGGKILIDQLEAQGATTAFTICIFGVPHANIKACGRAIDIVLEQLFGSASNWVWEVSTL